MPTFFIDQIIDYDVPWRQTLENPGKHFLQNKQSEELWEIAKKRCHDFNIYFLTMSYSGERPRIWPIQGDVRLKDNNNLASTQARINMTVEES